MYYIIKSLKWRHNNIYSLQKLLGVVMSQFSIEILYMWDKSSKEFEAFEPAPKEKVIDWLVLDNLYLLIDWFIFLLIFGYLYLLIDFFYWFILIDWFIFNWFLFIYIDWLIGLLQNYSTIGVWQTNMYFSGGISIFTLFHSCLAAILWRNYMISVNDI